jgi:hypothetical protein
MVIREQQSDYCFVNQLYEITVSSARHLNLADSTENGSIRLHILGNLSKIAEDKARERPPLIAVVHHKANTARTVAG